MKFKAHPDIIPLYNETVLTFHIDNKYRDEVVRKWQEIDLNSEYTIDVNKIKSKRSLDANAYAWVLMGKIADKLKISVTGVYRKIIQDMSVYEIMPIKEEAIDRFGKAWERNGAGWIWDDLGRCKNYEGYHNIRCFYGSSTYSPSEMNHFIELIQDECRNLDIEYLTPDELGGMENAGVDKTT